MELRVKNIGRNTPQKAKKTGVPASDTPKAAAEATPFREGPHYSITVRYGTLLCDTLQNMIRSSHTAQDFTYASVSDFIRAALNAYREGMTLTELDQSGPKCRLSNNFSCLTHKFSRELE